MNLYILKKISNPSNPNYSTCEVFKFPQSKVSPNSCTACLLLQHLSLYSAHLLNSSSLLKYIMEKTQKNCKEKIHQQKQSTLVMQQSTTALYRSRTQRISPPLPTNDHTLVKVKLKKSNSLSEKELKLAAIAISLNVRLRTSDMPVSMQEHALRYARSLVGSTSAAPPPQRLTPTLLARSLKKEFDGLYGPAWHCVVGKSFGSFVTHSAGGFVYFSLDSLSFLLFKTEVQLVKDSPLPAPPRPL